MKLFILFLLIATTHLNAKSYSQNISLHGNNISLKEAFRQVEKQTGYSFFIKNRLLKDAEPVSVSLKNATLDETMQILLKEQQLFYVIVGRTVVLKKKKIKEGVGKVEDILQLPNRRITGIVKDEETGQPLGGASIKVKGKRLGTVADAQGKFELDVTDDMVLEISFLGYAGKEIAVVGRSSLVITLVKVATDIDELVVIGYGKVKRKDLTGSIVDVKMDDIKNTPVTSVDLALQGRVSGAEIMATTGEPGATTTIRIRGTRSISATNEPLIVVDGIIDGVSSLNDINPADIKSISVLKDASATAIYGSRGSNGVVIITTNSGGGGKPRVVFNNTIGISQLPRRLDIMDASQFAQYRNDYAYFATTDNYGKINEYTPQSEYPYPDPFSLGKGTDWVEEITRIAPYHTHYLSLSGGSDKASYYASVGYDNNQGIIYKSGLKRLTGRFNIDYKILSWLKVGYKYNFSNLNQKQNVVNIGGASWWQGAIFLNPLIKVRSDFNDLWYSGQKFNSPRAMLDNDVIRDLNGNNATNTVFVELEPIKNLILNSQLNYYTYGRHTFQFDPGTLPAKAPEEGARAYRGEYNRKNLMSQTTLSYSKDWLDINHIDFTVGVIGQKETSDNLTLQGSGYQSDFILWNNMGAIPDKENYSGGSSNSLKTSISYLARFNYNYKSKYYFTVTGRRDGSSNFAINKKWAFFPSTAIKWVASNEEFLKSVNWLNGLSFRMSAGRTGNDGISSYQSLSALGSTTSGYLFDGSQPVAFYPSRLASEDLSWEKTDMYDLGTDIALFNNRVNITIDGYLSYTSDLILNVQVPVHTGYSTRLANVGKTSNKGIEFNIETININKSNFSWNSSFSISHNKQMVEDIATVDKVPVYSGNSNNSYMMYGYVAGYPLNSLWGFQYGGTWKSQAEVDRNKITKAYVSTAPAMYTPGAPRYYDIDHNGSINEDDLIYLGNADPYVYGGLQNTFNIKDFMLSVFVNYSLGGRIYNISEQWMAGGVMTNQYAYMLNAWHPVRNPDSDLPRAGAVDNIASDRMVYNASYLRLKTVTIGYNWNTGELTNDIIKNIQFSLTGENLLLWKKYNGFDPDVSTSGTSSTLRRADVGAYPKPRTFVLSIQMKF